MNKVRYIKVDWPISRKFREREGCYKCIIDMVDNSMYQTIFVPEDIYEEVMKNNDIRYE